MDDAVGSTEYIFGQNTAVYILYKLKLSSWDRINSICKNISMQMLSLNDEHEKHIMAEILRNAKNRIITLLPISNLKKVRVIVSTIYIYKQW